MAKRTVLNLNHALNMVNRIRMCLDNPALAQLPQAIPGDANNCVLARALSNGWRANVSETIELVYDKKPRMSFDELEQISKALRAQGFISNVFGGVYDPIIVINLPKTFRTLIQRFDAHMLADLITDDELKKEFVMAQETLEESKNPHHMLVESEIKSARRIVAEYKRRVKS